MISERSCDAEDWTNGNWNFSLTITNDTLKYVKIDNGNVTF